MKQVLHDYDIYPKVFPVGVAAEITVRGLGVHTRFSGDYTVVVQRLDAAAQQSRKLFETYFLR